VLISSFQAFLISSLISVSLQFALYNRNVCGKDTKANSKVEEINEYEEKERKKMRTKKEKNI
jgi:hypothetical protein